MIGRLRRFFGTTVSKPEWSGDYTKISIRCSCGEEFFRKVKRINPTNHYFMGCGGCGALIRITTQQDVNDGIIEDRRKLTQHHTSAQ